MPRAPKSWYQLSCPLTRLASDFSQACIKVCLYGTFVSGLRQFKDAPPFNLNFNYCSVVGKLNYLTQTSRGDIMYATHQIGKFSPDPREHHGEAILYLVWYLKIRDVGVHFKPQSDRGFECYCKVDFSGNCNESFADVDPSTSKSWSWWVVFYAGCPIIWAFKLQSQTALSTTEVEDISMSMALCDVIPIMDLIQEMKEHHIPVICSKPCVYCKVFEANAGELELARLPKLCPPHQAHQCLLPPLLWTCTKGTYQDLPSKNFQSDCWCAHKGTSTKKLCMSRRPSVQKIAPQAAKVRECYILGYFGSYIPILLNYDTCHIVI